jgi:predicted signal transduction protein with EAL and GGDEF domain
MPVLLAIDDFGTGYSSMSLMKHFPIDTIKIDRSFVRDLHDDSEDQAIAQAIINMGKALGMTVVADGRRGGRERRAGGVPAQPCLRRDAGVFVLETAAGRGPRAPVEAASPGCLAAAAAGGGIIESRSGLTRGPNSVDRLHRQE